MPIDPKWLEILKASGWQTAAISVACGIFIFLSSLSIIPEFPVFVAGAYFVGILCACLTFSVILSLLYKTIMGKVKRWQEISNAKKGFVKYIPYMTE